MKEPLSGCVALLSISFGCLAAHAADGIYERPSLNTVPTKFEGAKLSVRMPLIPTQAPKVCGLFLYDSDKGDENRFTIHLAFDKAPPLDWNPVIILGDTTVLEPVVGQVHSYYKPHLKFGVNDGRKASQLMERLRIVVKLSSERVWDMRLTNEMRNDDVKIIGNLPESEVDGVRKAVFEYAREQAIRGACYLIDAKEREAAMKNWPGRHPMRIGATNYPRNPGIGAYYAPNAGCQLEKQGGKWVVVGG